MKRLVLVRPAGPRNVGMIVRALVNFGPCELVLVAPERPSLLVHPEFEQMSHGVERASERCRVVTSLAEALAGTTHSVGFTARPKEGRVRLDWRTRRAALAELAAEPESCLALVFGAEVGGLSVEEVAQLAELVVLPTSTEHTSLNLAVAAAIVLSDLFLERPPAPRERGVKPLAHEAREFLKANLKHVFGERVARTPSARRDILDAIERVFSRAPLEDRDARAWHLMLRALGSTLTPPELGLELGPSGARHAALKSLSLGKPRVLIVAPAAEAAARARSLAAQVGFAVESAASAQEAGARLAEFAPDLVAALGEPGGLELLGATFPDARLVDVTDQQALARALADELARRATPGASPGC